MNPRADRITVDGEVLSLRPRADVKWVVLYKPKGALTTTNDEKGAGFLLFSLFLVEFIVQACTPPL